MSFARFCHRTQSLTSTSGAVLTALLMLAIPFSTSLTSILSIMIALIWLASCRFLQLPVLIRQNTSALFALLLFLYLIIAISYSSASLSEATRSLKKYRELLLLVILIPFLAEEKYRRWQFQAFVLASIVTLLGSYAMSFDLIPSPESAKGSPSFRMRITHSLFIAFFAYYCAHQTLSNRSNRFYWISLYVLSFYNIFFIVQGRTGQLIYILLISLFSVQRLTKAKALLFIGLHVIFLALFINFSEGGTRINEGLFNSQSYLQGKTETQSSMGQRLTFWKHSLALIAESPWLGQGTGSFAKGYQRLAAEDEIESSNAHNEYLMIAVQTGALGLLIFLGFMISFYWHTKRLPPEYKWFAQGTIIAFAINSLFNSTMLDHTEGHWFACLMALSLAPLSSNTPSTSDLS